MPYDERAAWPLIRDAQLKAGAAHGCGVAVAVDIGEEMDIHPKDKLTVGRRLARLALHGDYGMRAVTPMGPVLERAVFDGNRVRLFFRNADGGLEFRGSQTEETLFYLADSSRKFHVADVVELDGNTVVISAKSVLNPIAVRYAWADNPTGRMLYNGDELPASPFRTDTW